MRSRFESDRGAALVLLFGLLVLPLGGCSPKEGWPWSRNLADFPGMAAQQQALDPPEGTLPVEEGELTGFAESEELPVNPLGEQRPGEKEGEGRALFGKYCAACHGIDAKGRELTDDMMTPDLTEADYRDYSEDDFYSIIVDGGLSMPDYRQELSIRERWLIVGYLEDLAVEK